MVSGVMESTPAAHPHASLIDAVESLLDDLAYAPSWTMRPGDLTELLPRLARVRNRLDGLQLQLLREADRHEVGDAVGAANTAGWWATTTRTTKLAAHRQVALAARLDDDAHTTTAAALRTGSVSVEQAAVILDAVEALPAELVTPTLRADAETHLVELAAHHDPKDLRVLGRKVLDVLAPEVAEEHERWTLENQEAHALATATFSLRHDGQGSVYGRFKIPVLAGEMLTKHLAALAAPRHRAAKTEAADGPAGDDRVSRQLSLGQAFVEYIETRAADDTPKAGGLAATVVVTMTLENLLGDSQWAALLDTGTSISASEARRLACEAGIIPAVLGTRSQPLDLGRTTRFHTPTQRHALALRDQGCAAAGCDWPPGMCHAHHAIPWSKGGHTNAKDGLLLCPRHHTLAHDARYQLKTDKSGRVTFTRRR
jgi:hypothetical protein